MGEKTDQAKGRVKEAVGNLTDNQDLKREAEPIVWLVRPRRSSATSRTSSKT